MSGPTNPNSELRQLRRRLTLLEDERSTRRRFTVYSVCYPVLAGLAIALTFVPMLDEVTTTSTTGASYRVDYGSLWQGAGDSSGQAVFLMFGLACLLLVAACRPMLAVGVPISVVIVAGLLVLLLLDRFGIGGVEPSLAESGWAALACFTLTGLLGSAHTAQLLAGRRRSATDAHQGASARGAGESSR